MPTNGLKKAIDLTTAIILLEEAMNTPLSSDTDKSKIFLTKTERKALFDLRKKISSISKLAEHQLKSDPLIDFDQQKLDKAHRESILKTHKNTKQALQCCIDDIKTLLNKERISQTYIQCLQATEKCLENLLALLNQRTEEKLKTAIDSLAANSIYKLCKQKGILYIPIAQKLDPNLGGEYVAGVVTGSEGKCAGEVISWTLQCAESEKIAYPLYAEKCQKIYQDRQFESSVKYKNVLNSNLNDFLERVSKVLKPNRLYSLDLFGDSLGHAIGLRIRQDGIFELCESNYFHAFCFNQEALTLLLTALLMKYALEGFNVAELNEADVLQAKATDNLYPHKVHIIQASTKPTSPEDDGQYRQMIGNYYLRSNQRYKVLSGNLRRQQELFNNFSTLLRRYTAEMNYEEVLREVYNSFDSVKPGETFIRTEDNKSALLAIVTARLKIVNSQQFQAKFSEKQQVLTEYKKIEERLTAEWNKTKEELIQNNRSNNFNTSVLLSLTGMSTKILQFITGLKKNETPIAIKSSSQKSQGSLMGNFTAAVKRIFGIKSTTIAPISHLVDMGLSSIYARINQTSQDKSNKLSRLIVATQNLIEIMQEIKTSLYIDTSEEPEKKALYLAYEQVFKQKLSTHINFLMGFLNELKLSTNANEMESKLKHLVPLTDLLIEQLLNIKANKDSLLQTIETIVQQETSEADIQLVLSNTDYQPSLQEWLASLKIIIRYITEVKTEYTESANLSEFDTTNMMFLVLHEKKIARINDYDKRIKKLQKLNNQLITQCQQTPNFDVFIEISNRLRNDYSDLFPIEDTLMADYAMYLDKMLGRGTPIILNDSDRRLVDRLNSIHKKIKDVITGIQQEITHTWEPRAITNLQSTDQVELTMQSFEIERAEVVIQAYHGMVARLQDVLDRPSSTGLINTFNTLIKPYLGNDNEVDFEKLSLRSPSIINSFWSQKTPGINSMKNAMDLMNEIERNPDYLLLDACPHACLIPMKLQIEINSLIRNKTNLIIKRRIERTREESHNTINQEETKILLRLIPCLYEEQGLASKTTLLVSLYNNLDGFDKIKSAFKLPGVKTLIRHHAITILDTLIAATDDFIPQHQRAFNLMDLKTKLNDMPLASMFELTQLQNEISQIIPGVLINFQLRTDYVEHIRQMMEEERMSHHAW